jgi:uncharacterized SAM-binding protein YcdF (DUF218 family)
MQKADLIIVLGGGISKEGILPKWVHSRLIKASSLYKNGISELLLLSGKGRDDFHVTEASAMKEVLLNEGFGTDNILLEQLSKDTLQNAFYSRVIHIDPLNLNSAIIITSKFHNDRTKLIFDNVLGDTTKCIYDPIDDDDIDSSLLVKRSITEQKLINYYQKLFSSIPKHCLKTIHDVIQNEQNEYNVEYNKLAENLKNDMVLY